MEIDRDEMGSERCQGNVVMKPVNADGIKVGNIPEWLLVEVLIRLPVKLVFRSKLVSKQWLSVISDPYFVRMYISRASMSPQLQPWTFISHTMHVDGYLSSDLKHQLLVDIHSQDLKCPSFYVLPCPNTQHPHGGRYRIVGGSNGLVLYGRHEGYVSDIARYNICNPVTGKWIVLPPHAQSFEIVSRGFLTHIDNGILTSYRVVRLDVPWKKSNMIRFEVFLSEIGVWKDFSVFIDKEIEVASQRMPTALNGILHWITRKHGMIAYDPYHMPNYLRFIALPDDIDLTCNDKECNGILSLLDVHQGRLRYFESCTACAHPHRFLGFGVWILNDYSTGDWCLQHEIRLSDILYDDVISDTYFLLPISFHPFDSDIVFLGYKHMIISYNMKTRKLEAHGASLDVENTTINIDYGNWPCWWSTILLMIPPWPIYIPPVPSFGVTRD